MVVKTRQEKRHSSVINAKKNCKRRTYCPNSRTWRCYISHISPKSGSAAKVTNDLLACVNNENLGTEFQAIGTDGTNLNIGWKQGVISSMENRIERPLQWLTCLLHLNELPFRNLFTHLDGPTSVPRAFGKQLNNAHNLTIVKFNFNC